MREGWKIFAVLIMSRAATPRPQPAGIVGVHTSRVEASPLAEFRFDDDEMVWRRAGRGGHVFRVERSPTSRCRTRACMFAHIMSWIYLCVLVMVASSVFSPSQSFPPVSCWQGEVPAMRYSSWQG
jgi:hypothetical protein